MRQHLSGGRSVLLLLALVASAANAQNFSATKVFAADSYWQSGTTGLGGYCDFTCSSSTTTYEPFALTDFNVAYAIERTSVSNHYGGSYQSHLVVWDQGAQAVGPYLYYNTSYGNPYWIAASNVGAIPTSPTGNYAPPPSAGASYLQGVSNSGRLLAYGYDAVSSGFTAPKVNPWTDRYYAAGNDLYVSKLGGGWDKVAHDASLNDLIGVDVNNAGQAIGYSVDDSGRSTAFYTTGDGGTLKLLELNASESFLGSINDKGIAAGLMRSGPNDPFHVFTFDTNKNLLLDLGVDPGGNSVLKINDAGQIVRGDSLYDPEHAQWVRPSVDGLSGTWSLTDVNNHGDILAKSASGVYILQAVPEPATLLMTGLGLAGIGFVARKKQQRAITITC